MGSQIFGHKTSGDGLSSSWVNSMSSLVHARTGGNSIRGANANIQYDTNSADSITLDFKQHDELLNAVPGGLVYGNHGRWSTSCEIGGTPYFLRNNAFGGTDALSASTAAGNQVQWLVRLVPLKPGDIYTLDASRELYEECKRLPNAVLTLLNNAEISARAAIANNIARLGASDGFLGAERLQQMYNQQMQNVVLHFNRLRSIRKGDGLLAMWVHDRLVPVSDLVEGDIVAADFAVFNVEPVWAEGGNVNTGILPQRTGFRAQVIYLSSSGGGSVIATPSAPNETIVKIVCSEETGCRIIEPIIGNFFLAEHLVPLPVDYDEAGNKLLTDFNGGSYRVDQFSRRAYFNTAGTVACESYANYDPIRAAYAGGEDFEYKVPDWRPDWYYSYLKYIELELKDENGDVKIDDAWRIRGEARYFEERTSEGVVVMRHPLYLLRREPAISQERCVKRHDVHSFHGLASSYMNGTHYGLGDGMDDSDAYSSDLLYTASGESQDEIAADPVIEPKSPESNRYGFTTKPFCIGEPDSNFPNLAWDGKIDIISILREQDGMYRDLLNRWLQSIYNFDLVHEHLSVFGAVLVQAWQETLHEFFTPGNDGKTTPLMACLEPLNNYVYIPGDAFENHSGVIVDAISDVYNSAMMSFESFPIYVGDRRFVFEHDLPPIYPSDPTLYAQVGFTAGTKSYWRTEGDVWKHQDEWVDPRFVTADMFLDRLDTSLRSYYFEAGIFDVLNDVFRDVLRTIRAHFEVRFNELLREQLTAMYDKLLSVINATFYETAHLAPDAVIGSDPWEGAFANYLAKKLLEVTEQDIRNAIDEAYRDESDEPTGETVEQKKEEEYQRADLFIRQWCDLIYRPHVDVLLRGSLTGWHADLFEGFDVNLVWSQTLPNLNIPTLICPNFEMYYSPENGLNTEIGEVNGNPASIVAIFIADRGEWYKDVFEMQAQLFLFEDAEQVYSYVDDYVSQIHGYLENHVFAHYSNLLNGVYLELMTEESERDVQNLVGGDGRYLEIAQTLKSYVGWMSTEMKSWMHAVMEDWVIDVKDWAPPPLPSPDYVPMYDETALCTSNIARLIDPLVVTAEAVNQAFLATRSNAWADYVQIRLGQIPAGASFIGLFEAQKESFRQMYESLFWQSLSLTMLKTDIPFGFSIGNTTYEFTSFEELSTFYPTATVGTTAIVYAVGGQEFYIINNAGEWEQFELPTPEEFYATLWDTFRENLQTLFMPRFKRAAYAVYTRFVNTFKEEYLKELASLLRAGLPTIDSLPMSALGNFWKLYEMLADSIIFEPHSFSLEKFQDKYYQIPPNSEHDESVPVTFIDRLASLCGDRMANQQNSLSPNRRTRLNYRSILGLFFRDYAPEGLHSGIKDQLDLSFFGSGWLPGLQSIRPTVYEPIPTTNLLADYKPDFPGYNVGWHWYWADHLRMPDYDSDGTLLDYGHFETANKLDLYAAYMNIWGHTDGSGNFPAEESRVDTFWEMLMCGFLDLLDRYFLPLIMADPQVERGKVTNTGEVIDPNNPPLFINNRVWRQREGEKLIRTLHESVSEQYAKLFRERFNEAFLLQSIPKCRVEPIPPQNWKLTLSEEKAQRHNLLAFCPSLDQNEILIPGEIVGFTSQTAEYRMPAVDMYNRPLYDKSDESGKKRIIDRHTWQYALVTAPPQQYTVNVCGTPKIDVYVYEVKNVLVRKKVKEYVDAVRDYELALAEWVSSGYRGDRPRLPYPDDPMFKDVYESMILRRYTVPETFDVRVLSPGQHVAVSIKQKKETGAIDSRNPYGVVNDLKWPHVRGGFYKMDAMGRKYLCGFRCESIPYGNAVRAAHVDGISFTATDNCAPVFVHDMTVLTRETLNDRMCLIPVHTTQWINHLRVLPPIPIPGQS